MDDPVIRPVHLYLTLLAAKALAVEVEAVEPEDPKITASMWCLRDTLGGDADDSGAVMQLLLEAIHSRAPGLVHHLGPFLPQYLLAGVEATLRGEAPAELLPQKIWRFLPDNPITLGANGQPEATNWTDVTVKQFSQFQQAIRSLNHPARRGRKPKSTDAAPVLSPLSSHSDRDHLARCAYDMNQNGQNWKAIARVLWPKAPLPSTSAGRDAVYQKVRRLIHRGSILTDSAQ